MCDFKLVYQSAVQLLYSLHLEGAPVPENTDVFWSLILERDMRRLKKSRIKALEHITQDRAERFANFERHAAALIASIEVASQVPMLISILRKVLASEQNWTLELDNLFLTASSQLDATDEKLTEALRDVFGLSRQLNGLYQGLIDLLTESKECDLPKYLSEPLLGSAKRLQRIVGRALAIESPSQFPTDPDVSHLRLAEEQINDLREATDNMVFSLLGHLPEIDQQIAEVLENFVPERLDPVDRAILRLATWEILFCPNRPGSKIISDAIKTARLLSNTKSTSFVNGVLGKINNLKRGES